MHVKSRSGFTVVEIFIVIVVIAILAAVAIVAFNGIRQRSTEASLNQSLSSMLRRLEADKITRGTYTASLNDIENSKESANGQVTYQYTSDGSSYCITATQNGTTRSVSSSQKTPTSGPCAGHSDPSAPVAPAEVAHTQKGEIVYDTEAGGRSFPITLTQTVQPTDYVLVLLNSRYNVASTVTPQGGSAMPQLYSQSMGASGYQMTRAFGTTGLSGQPTLDLFLCWSASCSTAGWNANTSYIVYVIKGLGSNPIFTATDTSYGVNSANGELVSPARQTVSAGSIAIFTYVYYGNDMPLPADNSSPSQTWQAGNLRTRPSATGSLYALTAVHTTPSVQSSISYGITINSDSTVRRTGTSLFVLTKN